MESSGGNAHINMFLTDAPADYDAVVINIQAVEINTGDGGWQTFDLIHPGFYDLLHLSSGIDTLMISEDISPASVTQIRLILGDGSYLVNNDVIYPLATPSAEESGLKLNVNYKFEAGIIYNLWLDFDAEQSIVQQGNGNYSLKPVIRVYTEAESGAISGAVFPAVGAYYVMAVNGPDTIGTYVGATGSFLISGLPSGTYSVTFLHTEGYLNVTIPMVEVTVGSVTDLGVVNIPVL